MDDRDRIERFAKSYAKRLESWRAEIQSLGEANPGPDHAARVFVGLLEDLAAAAKEETPSLERLRELPREDPQAPAALLAAVTGRTTEKTEDLAARWSVDGRALEFLGAYLARPFLSCRPRALAKTAAKEAGSPALCPTCRHEAALSFLLPENGERELWCRYCAARWKVRRLGCPFCGNAEQDELGSFYLEGQVGRRVDFCRRCRRYLKTVDLRQLAVENTAWQNDFQDLMSGDLDLAAVREGFVPPGSLAGSPATGCAGGRSGISDGGAL